MTQVEMMNLFFPLIGTDGVVAEGRVGRRSGSWWWEWMGRKIRSGDGYWILAGGLGDLCREGGLLLERRKREGRRGEIGKQDIIISTVSQRERGVCVHYAKIGGLQMRSDSQGKIQLYDGWDVSLARCFTTRVLHVETCACFMCLVLFSITSLTLWKTEFLMVRSLVAVVGPSGIMNTVLMCTIYIIIVMTIMVICA